MSEKIVLTRNQLAKFLPTPEAIKAFENLFKLSTVQTPNDIQALEIDISTAGAAANESEAMVIEIKQLLSFIAQSPTVTEQSELIKIIHEIISSPIYVDNITEFQKTLNELTSSSNNIHEFAELKKTIDELMILPPQSDQRMFDLDYIQFRNTHTVAKQAGTLNWGYQYGHLQFTHIGGLTQEIGLDILAHAVNTSGVTISKGQPVYYTGVTSGEPTFAKFIADGTIPSHKIMGLSSEDTIDGDEGHITLSGFIRNVDASGSAYTETWATGDLLYTHPTISGGLTNVKPTAPNICLPMATVIINSSTVGILYVRATIEQQLHYGSFSDSTDQTAAAANTAYALTFDTSAASNGVSIGTPTSRIVCAQSGLYEFSFSAQITSSSASTKTLWFWARKNGTDIANTAMKSSVSGSNVTVTASRSIFFSMAAGDYIEAMWATDDINVTIEAAPSTAFAPATPSVIMAVSQIAQ
jgi:hypothetical protein